MSAPDGNLARAADLCAVGQFAEAEGICHRHLAEQPGSKDALLLLAEIRLHQGRADDAATLLGQVLSVDSGNRRALQGLAIERLRRGRTADAERYCAAALSTVPDDPESLALMASIRAVQRRAPETERLFRQALRRGLDLASVHVRFGQFLMVHKREDAAAQAARRAVALRPDLAQAQFLLGVLTRRAGRPAQDAASAFLKALVLAPERAETCVHLVNTLAELGRVGAAAFYSRHGLMHDPANFPLWLELANTLNARGNTVAALAAYRHANRLSPSEGTVLLGFATLCRDSGNLVLAEAAMRRVVALSPENGDALGGMATILRAAERADDAETMARRACRIDGDSIPSLWRLHDILRAFERHEKARPVAQDLVRVSPLRSNTYGALASALRHTGRVESAVAALRMAVALDPDHVPSLVELTSLRADQGCFAEAETIARRTVRLAPGSPVAHNNLGLVLYKRLQFPEAESALHEAVRLEPDRGQWHHNLGIVLMTRQDLASGFRELEWRWKNEAVRIHQRSFPAPALADAASTHGALQLAIGRTLLIWGEQGIGDEILYSSLVPMVQALGIRCVLECAPRLVPLFARSMPGIEVVERRDPPHPRTLASDIAFHCPVGSLGRWLLRTPGDLPRRPAYLAAAPVRTSHLKSRYGERHRMVVGISWRSKGLIGGARKSAPIAAWDPVLSMRDVAFVNLQYGDCREELEDVRHRLGTDVLCDPEIDQMQDMDAFAAQVAAMDLVLTTSNTTAHLAGALGVPVWTLLPTEPLLWYWFSERDDCPWYPSMRLFRQASQGDWDELLARVAEALASLPRAADTGP